MNYIAGEMAQKLYANILALHQMNNSLFNKVPAIEDELEEMLALPELAGVDNEKGGQRKWLKDNKIWSEYGVIKGGYIPADIVMGLLTIFPYRNMAKHEKKMAYATYLGIFDCMVRAISFFSNTPLPDEIQAICDGEEKSGNNEPNKKEPKSKGFNAPFYVLTYSGIDSPPYTWDTLKQKILNGEISRQNEIKQFDSSGCKVTSYPFPRIDSIPDLKLCFDENAKGYKSSHLSKAQEEEQAALAPFTPSYVLTANNIDSPPYTWDTLKQKILNGEISRQNEIKQFDSSGCKVTSYPFPRIDNIPDLKLCFDEYDKKKKQRN